MYWLCTDGTGDKCPKEEEVLTVPEYRLGDLSLRQLVDELQEVVEWMPFGLYLGLAVATLKQIQKNHQTTPLCKQEMLYTWMRERRPTWLKVVEALVHIKMFRLAVKIASKYGKLHCVDSERKYIFMHLSEMGGRVLSFSITCMCVNWGKSLS